MAQDAKRQGKRRRLYEILIISLGEGEKTRKYRASRLTFVLAGIVVFLVSIAIMLALLMYTPLAVYVPIPNPLLERKYGRQLVETQERLNELGEELLLLRDYNSQLRKALGGDIVRDSSQAWNALPSVEMETPGQIRDAEKRRGTESSSQTPSAAEPAGEEPGMLPPYTGAENRGEAVQPHLPLIVPTEGYVSQGFDPSQGHYGMDFAGKRGTTVYAAGDGQVVFSGWTYEDGNMIILAHGGGYMTVYKHNQTLLRGAQTAVARGEPIALLGTSGKTSLGPHLHFEVWRDGVPQDPNEYLLHPVNPH
jgi:murein DD-endopeptidase MepM/ murein hydrolase activator NlpD